MVSYRRAINIMGIEFVWSQTYLNMSWITLEPLKYALKSVSYGDIFNIGVAIHMPLAKVHATLDSHTGFDYYFSQSLSNELTEKKKKQLNKIIFNNSSGASTSTLFKNIEKLNVFLETLQPEDFINYHPASSIKCILGHKVLDS